MTHHILALNSAWMPCNIISHKDAFRLLCKGHCKAMDEAFYLHTFDSWLEHHGVFNQTKSKCNDSLKNIKTVRFDIPIPEIVVLDGYSKTHRRDIVFSKESLFIRDSGECQYCGSELKYEDATIDHIHPRSKGGEHSFENCVLACRDCNHTKDDYLLEDLKTHKLRSKPYSPSSTNPLYRYKNKVKIKESWRKFLFHENRRFGNSHL